MIGLNLCPFAAKPWKQNSIRFVISHSADLNYLLSDLHNEMLHLQQNSEIETTLLIIADQLSDFMQFNDVLDDVDQLIANADFSGVFQVASFHPDYCFADTEPDELSNWSNRSPYPMLHILREKSVQQALNAYPDSNKIGERNISKLNAMSAIELRNIFNIND